MVDALDHIKAELTTNDLSIIIIDAHAPIRRLATIYALINFSIKTIV